MYAQRSIHIHVERQRKKLSNNLVYDERIFLHVEHGINVCLPHSRTDEYKETLYYWDSNAAGELIFIAGLQEIVIVIAAETLFPGYSNRANDLSSLGCTIP